MEVKVDEYIDEVLTMLLREGGSADRPHLFLEWVASELTAQDGDVFWPVLREAWPGFDLIPHAAFADEFAAFRSSCPPPPPDLPERFTAYRGQDADAPLGLSWTLDRKVAEGFARGHRGIQNPTPQVLEREFTREQALFLIDAREEREVVLWAIPA